MIVRKQYVGVLLFLLAPLFLFAQHSSLMKYNGEIGGGIGPATYVGQIGEGSHSYTTNFNFFYRKLLTNRFGVRINYEYIPLTANDSLSNNPQIISRGFKFYKDFHYINFSLEYFFRDIRYLNSANHLIPYVGVGMGYMLNELADHNNFDNYLTLQQVTVNQFWPVCTVPVNLGFNYRLKNNINFFGEFTYHFTTSDLLDDFSAATPVPTNKGLFIAQNKGKDQFYSLKLGISKSFFTVYGIDKYKKKKKKGVPVENGKEVQKVK